jgi:DNA-binding transcriptional MerR regulator
MAGTEDRELIGTGDAARALGVNRTTLARWATAGVVTPATRTVGGHLRWNLDQLREQVAKIIGEAPSGGPFPE